MFVRKLYYDLTTGGLVASHMRIGDVRMTTFAEDAAALPALSGRSEADTGCMVWTEPEAAVESAFAACTGVSVDVTQQPHAVVWEHAPDDADESEVTES